MTTAQLPYIGGVRQVCHKDTEWYLLGDVCSALGLDLDEAAQLVEPGDLDEWQSYSDGYVPIVSAAGACALVFVSHTPEARAFRRWVLDELWVGES